MGGLSYEYVYGTGIPQTGNCISYIRFIGKGCEEAGGSQIALEATDMGRPLYEKYGFVKMEDEMEIK